MMHNAIPIGGRTDLAFLGFVDQDRRLVNGHAFFIVTIASLIRAAVAPNGMIDPEARKDPLQVLRQLHPPARTFHRVLRERCRQIAIWRVWRGAEIVVVTEEKLP